MPDRPRSPNVSVSAREADAKCPLAFPSRRNDGVEGDQLFSERLMLIYISARKSNVDAEAVRIGSQFEESAVKQSSEFSADRPNPIE